MIRCDIEDSALGVLGVGFVAAGCVPDASKPHNEIWFRAHT